MTWLPSGAGSVQRLTWHPLISYLSKHSRSMWSQSMQAKRLPCPRHHTSFSQKCHMFHEMSFMRPLNGLCPWWDSQGNNHPFTFYILVHCHPHGLYKKADVLSCIVGWENVKWILFSLLHYFDWMNENLHRHYFNALHFLHTLCAQQTHLIHNNIYNNNNI